MIYGTDLRNKLAHHKYRRNIQAFPSPLPDTLVFETNTVILTSKYRFFFFFYLHICMHIQS